MPEDRYRLTVRGPSSTPRSARLYDPVADLSFEAEPTPRGSGAIETDVPVTDYPCLLIFEE